ncbi:MAG: hypothetical protein QM761_04950 [Pseudoxanthomonas sp.]
MACLPLAAQAATRLDYQAGISYLHSNNITLSDTDRISENVLMPSLDFTMRQDGSAVQMSVDGSLQYLMFENDLFKDNLRGDLNGRLNWVISPERMHWVVEDYLSEQPVSTLSGYSLTNQQRVNVFVTGPSFFARLSPTTLAQADLRYSDTYAEDIAAFDGDRYNGAVRVIRELTPNQKFSFNAEATRVRYEGATASFDYDREDAYVGYEAKSSALDLSLQAGYTRVEPKGDGDRKSDPLLRAEATWQATPRSTVHVRASHEYADTTQTLIADAIVPGAPGVTAPNPNGPLMQVGPDAFRQTRFDGDYTYDSERVRFAVQPYYARVHYFNGVDMDQDIHGALASLDYTLRPGWRMTAVVSDQRRELNSLDRKDTDRSAGLALGRDFSRHWIGRVEIQRRERNSSEPGQSYSENAVIISFHYRR